MLTKVLYIQELNTSVYKNNDITQTLCYPALFYINVDLSMHFLSIKIMYVQQFP